MTTFNLVVKQPFLSYQKGDLITDQSVVSSILDVNSKEHELIHSVIKVAATESVQAQSLNTKVNINTVAEPHDMSTTTT